MVSYERKEIKEKIRENPQYYFEGLTDEERKDIKFLEEYVKVAGRVPKDKINMLSERLVDKMNSWKIYEVIAISASEPHSFGSNPANNAGFVWCISEDNDWGISEDDEGDISEDEDWDISENDEGNCFKKLVVLSVSSSDYPPNIVDWDYYCAPDVPQYITSKKMFMIMNDMDEIKCDGFHYSESEYLDGDILVPSSVWIEEKEFVEYEEYLKEHGYPENMPLEEVYELEHSQNIEKNNSEKIQDRIREALFNTKNLIIAGKSYLDSQLLQRIEGPNNAGSSYENITPADLLQKLHDAEWEEVQVDGVMPGCTAFKTKLPGKNGIIDIDALSSDTQLYAIDPKGTGTIGIGAAGVEKTPEEDTYMILGMEDGVEVVFTFHPGKPVSPSMVETKDYPHGSKITIEEAKRLGFSKVKFITDEMKKEFDENDVHQKIKEKSDDFEI